MKNVKVSVENLHEWGINDYVARYSYGDDAKIRSDLDYLINKLGDNICYNDLEGVSRIARKIAYTAKNIDKLREHNEMIEFARRAVLDVPKGGFVTRNSVRELFKIGNTYRGKGDYEKFGYGATIIALEELVADGKLKVVRTYGNEIAYKRV